MKSVLFRIPSSLSRQFKFYLADKGQTVTDFFRERFAELQNGGTLREDYLPMILALRTLRDSNLVLRVIQGEPPAPDNEEMVNVGYRSDDEQYKSLSLAIAESGFPIYGVTLMEFGQTLIQQTVSGMTPQAFTAAACEQLKNNSETISKATSQEQPPPTWSPSL